MPAVLPVISAIGAAAAGAGASLAAAAPIIAAGTGVASTAIALDQGNKASKAGKNAAADQAASQSKIANDLYAQKQGAESDANALATRDSARNRQKALALGAGGRRSTILTSPLGAVGAPAGERKTLLGA